MADHRGAQPVVYTLQLACGKYYVGKTASLVQRYAAHASGGGAAWTKKYKPVRVVDVIKNPGPFDEDNQTKRMMATHGVHNVRGGSYCGVKLDPETVAHLETELDTAYDKCFACGEPGHQARDCDASSQSGESVGEKLVEKLTNTVMNGFEVGGCERCGRSSHQAHRCYARTLIDGTIITPEVAEMVRIATDVIYDCGTTDSE